MSEFSLLCVKVQSSSLPSPLRPSVGTTTISSSLARTTVTGDYSTSTCRRPLDPYSLAYGQVYHSHTGCTRVLCRAGSSSPGIPDDNNEARPLCERHDAAAFVVPSPSTLELKKKACCIDRTSSTAESQRPTRHTRAPARRAVADKAVRLRPSGFRRHVAWRRRGCRSAAAGGLTFTVFQGWTWRHSRRAYFIVCQAAATRSEVCGARALTAQAGVHLHKTRFSTPSLNHPTNPSMDAGPELELSR